MNPSIPPVYELKNVIFSHNNHFQLTLPELTIQTGEALGIAGPNGCGKSTLLRLLAFLCVPTEGQIRYNGQPTQGLLEIIRRQVTLLNQRPYLLKRSVFENVAYGLKVRKDTARLEYRVHQALETTGLSPRQFDQRLWYELSGGEAQRVALAARLILNPSVLILDEPVTSVDQESAHLIQKAIHHIRQMRPLTVIASSHDRIWLNALAPRVLRMAQGHIIGSGLENIIDGPWHKKNNSLWQRNLSEKACLFALHPPHPEATAVLHPSDIILARQCPAQTSARNILKGTILALSNFENSSDIRVDLETHGLKLTAALTRDSMIELQLVPGDSIWLIFKAGALKWS